MGALACSRRSTSTRLAHGRGQSRGGVATRDTRCRWQVRTTKRRNPARESCQSRHARRGPREGRLRCALRMHVRAWTGTPRTKHSRGRYKVQRRSSARWVRRRNLPAGADGQGGRWLSALKLCARRSHGSSAEQHRGAMHACSCCVCICGHSCHRRCPGGALAIAARLAGPCARMCPVVAWRGGMHSTLRGDSSGLGICAGREPMLAVREQPTYKQLRPLPCQPRPRRSMRPARC